MAETTVNKFLSYEGFAHFIESVAATGIKGKVLSETVFTKAMAAKLDGVASDDDLTELKAKVADLVSYIESDSNGAIDKFKEIVAFLKGIADTETLEGMMSNIATQIADAKKEGTDAQTSLANYKTEVTTALSGKVDTVAGKGLSTNDYTTADKNLVATIGNKLDADDLVEITDEEIDALLLAATA